MIFLGLGAAYVSIVLMGCMVALNDSFWGQDAVASPG